MTAQTHVGAVRHVLGATITVELSPDLAGVAPIWEGKLQPVGQIGSIVRIPQGPMTLLGTVTMVGIAELAGPLAPSIESSVGDRWLKVQLVGEIDGLGIFHRGISTYPGLDDAVHFATKHDLRAVFPDAGAARVRFGTVASTSDVPVALDAERLVTRHAAIVGSTGSGKTSSVCTLLQNFIHGGWGSANIIVIDPHGEYADALVDFAATRSVLETQPERRLDVPYWTLPAADLLKAVGGSDSATATLRFMELVQEQRRAFAALCPWLRGLDHSMISADTPLPFDMREVWYQLESDNRATYQARDFAVPCIRAAGDKTALIPPEYDPPGAGNAAPFRGPRMDLFANLPERMRLRLRDPRLRFFFDFESLQTEDDVLEKLLVSWLGGERPVSVMDFSGVPGDVADLAIGAVLQNVFETALRSSETGIGRPAPVLIVLEEAHRYLGAGDQVRLAREVANRIAREGRKYGVGLLLVSQRPSELPDTALSQVGTIVALRLTNGSDQATVKAALPDGVAGLADALPSLRNGEAIVSGEAVSLPTRVIADIPNPRPNAKDPSVEPWRHNPPKRLNLIHALRAWRGLPEG
jgi:uncharacterized protein